MDKIWPLLSFSTATGVPRIPVGGLEPSASWVTVAGLFQLCEDAGLHLSGLGQLWQNWKPPSARVREVARSSPTLLLRQRAAYVPRRESRWWVATESAALCRQWPDHVSFITSLVGVPGRPPWAWEVQTERGIFVVQKLPLVPLVQREALSTCFKMLQVNMVL